MSHPPSHIGRYPVEEEIGRGGMGVVYRARDPLLQRPIALKLLRETHVADREWLLRFELEARALAALNHPNIAIIHGLEATDDGGRFLVLEYVEGESLSRRLEPGPLPPEETLRIVRQITHGLEAAHRRGIVHCDLKPDNVRITPDGLVKILDFGVARSLGAPAPPPTDTDATIATSFFPSFDEPGGTPGYMSPEQARGQEVDQRTDIWALGCILFRCLSGRPPFRGDTVADTVAATLTAEPHWPEIPDAVPPALVSLVRRCMEKDPARRPTDMAEVRAAIDLFLERETDAPGRAMPVEEEETEPNTASWVETNLPSRLTSFVGRAWELEDVRRMLRAQRLVTLTGGGGCGKTRLAVEAADRLLPEFPGGAWMVELAPLTEPGLVVPTVAAELHVPADLGPPTAETVARAIGSRPMLLLLDNCEHVLAVVARTVETLLRRCPHLRVLATSREPLAIGGESLYPVEPLSVPGDESAADLPALTANDAIRLFVDRAAFAKSGFTLTAENAPGVLAICRRLDGVPLAIELAAARVKVLPVEEIRTRLDDRFRLLTRGTRTALAHHRTLRETIEWSYRLLEPEEQRLFRRLSVFSGGWTLRSACVLGDDEYESIDLLGRLVEKSLVMVEESGDMDGRYRFLETVRQFAREELESEGEAATATAAHFDCMRALAAEAARGLKSGEQARTLARLDREIENFRAALGFGLEDPARVPEAIRLAVDLSPFWLARGGFHEGGGWLAEALERGGATVPPRDRAAALNAAGALAAERRDPESAIAHYEECLALFLKLGDERGAATVAANMGNVMFDQDQPALARELHGQAHAMFAGLEDAWGIGESLESLGRAARALGETDEAERLFRERCRLAESVDDARGLASGRLCLAALHATKGDAALADEELRPALALVRELGPSPDLVRGLETAGFVRAAARTPDAAAMAATLYGAASALRQKLGYPPSLADARHHAVAIERSGALLGEEAFGAAWERGQGLAPEAAVESILAPAEPRTRSAG